jgi:hypothetical protein
LLEFNNEEGCLYYRIKDIKAAGELQAEIKKRILEPGPAVPTTSLCSIELEKLNYSLIEKGDKSRALKLASMIFMNRLVLSLESFNGLPLSETWKDTEEISDELEMIFDKISDSRKLMEKFE